jgi:hypothetical protein
MDTKFQPSFIPKAPVTTTVRVRGKGVNLFTLLGVVILLVTIGLAIGVFMWQQYLTRSVDSMKREIARVQGLFEPALVAELVSVDQKLKMAHNVLNNHFAFSSFFEFLEDITLRSVRFTSFDYTLVGSNVNISMEGEAESFAAVALQSDTFTRNAAQLRNSMISDLALDQRGNVTFRFTATLNPQLVSYRRSLQELVVPAVVEETSAMNTTSTSTQATTSASQ